MCLSRSAASDDWYGSWIATDRVSHRNDHTSEFPLYDWNHALKPNLNIQLRLPSATPHPWLSFISHNREFCSLGQVWFTWNGAVWDEDIKCLCVEVVWWWLWLTWSRHSADQMVRKSRLEKRPSMRDASSYIFLALIWLPNCIQTKALNTRVNWCNWSEAKTSPWKIKKYITLNWYIDCPTRNHSVKNRPW